MNTVTLILPKDTDELERKYTIALADAVADMLNDRELEYLIKELDKRGYEKSERENYE